MVDKEELKKKMSSKIIDIIDAMDILHRLDYFEVTLKHINGDVVYKPSFTIKDKVS